MAEVGTLVVRLTADLSEFSKHMEGAQKTLQSVGKRMTDVGKTLSTRVTLPIVGAGVAILKTAGDFEAGMNRVRALTGATGETFGALEEQAKLLGRTTQFTASQAADAMGFLAMAGFDANQILGAMPGTLELAASAQLDLGRAADIVSNILTGYGKDVEELGRVNDVLVKAFTRANVDLTMLGEAMKYAGPVASGMGVQFEEAAAAIGLMGNAGIQGSMAGTALRGALTRLANPTKQIKDAMAELGLQVYDSQGNLLPLVEIVRQLEQSGASTADMMVIFGQRAGPAMAALVSQGADALAEFTQELKESGGTASEIAAVQMEGFAGGMKALTSALEGLVLAIADSGLLEWATALAERVTAWLQRLAETNPEMLRLGTIIALVAAAIGPLLVVLGMAVSGAGALAGALSFLLSPIGLVVAAVAGLTAAWLIWGDDIKRTVGDVVGRVVSFFTGLKTSALDIWDGLVSGIKSAVNSIIGFINSLIRAWNRIEFRVPSVNIPFVGSFGGFSVRLPRIPEIPMLAEGGIVTRPTLAMIGEAGPEAVIPLNRGGVAVSGAPGGGYRTANIVIELDGRAVANIVGQHLVDELRLRTPIR